MSQSNVAEYLPVSNTEVAQKNVVYALYCLIYTLLIFPVVCRVCQYFPSVVLDKSKEPPFYFSGKGEW